MHRSAFEGVVKVFAMRGRAIDEGGGGGDERSRMADRGAWAVVSRAGKRARK